MSQHVLIQLFLFYVGINTLIYKPLANKSLMFLLSKSAYASTYEAQNLIGNTDIAGS